MPLKLLSLNVRGLRDNRKRHKLYYWLKHNNYDIILLQETHCANNHEISEWSKEWKGQTLWNNGSSNSRGVAILLKHDLKATISDEDNDKNGRFLKCNIEVDDNGHKQKYIICNIYAPNELNEKRKYFETTIKQLEKLDRSNNLIIGGDFNSTLNSQYDRKKQTNKLNEPIVNKLISNLDLEDIWRRRNPTKRIYTFVGGTSHSRIDYWLISKGLDSQVKNAEILNNPLTDKDHRAISLEIFTKLIDRGEGIWKMNLKVIENDIFREAFETFWRSWKLKIQDYDNKLIWWDLTKHKIKELTIWAAKKIKSNETDIKKKEETLNNLIQNEPTNQAEIQKLTKCVNSFYQEKAEAARIRARAQWFEEGEKSTRYFFNLEKKRAKNKEWERIKVGEKKYKTNIDDILKVQVEFYKKLYTSQPIDEDAADTLLNNIDKEITAADREKLEQPLSREEIGKAALSQNKNKSPGEDGIISEFYYLFWNMIGDTFTEIVDDIFAQNQLSNSQMKGVIILHYKNGEREEMKNWRPITLLNTDYKIIAKAIATRLNPILKYIIHPDQKGFVKGRNIGCGIRLIQDVIEYTNFENQGAGIIFLDQEKAFDRVERTWISKVLDKFNFGPNFIKWINILYKDTKSCILTNGYQSRYFNVTRSVRQGCPLAADLYIINAEPFAATIRKSKDIEGIKTPNIDGKEIEIKISLFADDTQLFNRSHKSILECQRIMKLYEKASGAKVNHTKTKGLMLGTWRTKPPPKSTFSWTTESIKALGIWHGYNIDNDKIWQEKFKRINNSLTVWKTRDLTFEGRVLLIKSLGFSVTNYQIEHVGIEDKHKNELKKMLWQFLWKNKTPLINRANAVKPKQEGGLNMIDIEAEIKTKQIKWMNKIAHEDLEEWNALGKFWLKHLDEKYNENNFILKCSDIQTIRLENIPKYYIKGITTWAHMLTNRNTITKEQILNENLFGNDKLRRNGKPLFFQNWAHANFKTINDIRENTGWIPSETVINRLNIRTHWIHQYKAIIEAIPRNWKIILDRNINNDMEKTFENTVKYNNQTLFINDKPLLNKGKLNNKLLKKVFIQNNSRPKGELKWEEKLGQEQNWDIIWNKINSLKIDRKAKQLQWKLIHRVIFTERKLRQINKSDGKCKICQKTEEDEIHLFFKCKYTERIWRNLESTINEKFRNTPKLTIEDILFGITDENNLKQIFINKAIFTTKWIIWKARCSYKYSKTKINVEQILQQISNHV